MKKIKRAVQGTAGAARQPKFRTALILMAIFKSTAFSEVRKSFGNITTYRHKGQNLFREKKTTVANPRTPAQVRHRMKFAFTVELSSMFGQAIAVGLKPVKEMKETVENCFVRLNKDCVTVNEALEVSVDFGGIVLAKGNRALPKVREAVVEAETGQLSVTFEEAGEFVSHSAEDDVFFCCLVEREMREVKFVSVGTRSSVAEGFRVELPASWDVQAENLAVYLFCTDNKRRSVSKTLYLKIG